MGGPGTIHVEEDREVVRMGETLGSGCEVDVRRRARCSGGAYLLARHTGGEDGSFGS